MKEAYCPPWAAVIRKDIPKILEAVNLTRSKDQFLKLVLLFQVAVN